MIILQTIAAFCLFFFGFSLMWACVHEKIKDWRSSFIGAFLFLGVFIWFLTELLSFFTILTPLGILCGWIGCIIILSTFCMRLHKNGKMRIKMPQRVLFSREYSVFIIIFAITFFIAIAYPPNNWDSMTYHLPRIEHWLQNKSLNHYYSSINRQLLSAPLAEIAILQGRALSGGDCLANLVQWFSFVGAVIGVSKIASHLGLNRKMQIAAALFFVTVPMAILQASSTQTDLVETVFIICLAERFLAWRKTGTLFESVCFGLALGLSILTKGTAYPIAFPFVLCFAIISIKYFRKRLAGAALAAILCLTLNLPHYTRNYISFGNPLGAHTGTVSDFSVKSFALTFIANIHSNIISPLPGESPILHTLNIYLEKLLDTLNADAAFPITRPIVESHNTLLQNEDIARNFLHTILLIIVFILLCVNKNGRRLFSLLVIGSWCMFAYCIPWQPWITRLQLPLFALSGPVFSMVFENKHKSGKFCMILLFSYALLPLALNISRPLIPAPIATKGKAIWNTPRDELVFTNRHEDGSYTAACAAIVQADIQNLGLIIGEDSWEYPLWRYIRRNSDKKITITHINGNNIPDGIDALFILNRGEIPDDIDVLFPFVKENLTMYNPAVFIRNPENKAEWSPLYLPYNLKIMEYNLGETVNLQGQRSGYQFTGWSFPETWGTWTDGERAVLAADVKNDSDLSCTLTVEHILYDNPVAIYAGGVLLGYHEFVKGDNVLHIPKETYGVDKALVIELAFNDPKSPLDLEMSNDSRKLGIGMVSFCIDKASSETVITNNFF